MILSDKDSGTDGWDRALHWAFPVHGGGYTVVGVGLWRTPYMLLLLDWQLEFELLLCLALLFIFLLLLRAGVRVLYWTRHDTAII